MILFDHTLECETRQKRMKMNEEIKSVEISQCKYDDEDDLCYS